VVICLECSAYLHMAQLMPLPLTVSCFSKIQIGFTFLVPAHLVIPGKRAVKRVCVCVVSEDVHCVVVAELSLLSRLSTLRYPHLLLSAGEPAARRLHRPQQSIDSSCLQGAQQQTRRPLSTAPYTMRTASTDTGLHSSQYVLRSRCDSRVILFAASSSKIDSNHPPVRIVMVL